MASNESPTIDDECDRVLDRLTRLGYVYGPERRGTLFPALDWASENGDVTEDECEAVGNALGLVDCLRDYRPRNLGQAWARETERVPMFGSATASGSPDGSTLPTTWS